MDAQMATPNIVPSKPHHEETLELSIVTSLSDASDPAVKARADDLREAATDAPISDLPTTCFSTAAEPAHSVQETVRGDLASVTSTRCSAEQLSGGAAVGPESMRVNTTGSQYQQNATLARLMNRPMQLALRGGEFSAPNSPRDEHEADAKCANPHLSSEKREEREASAEKTRAVSDVVDEPHVTLGGWSLANAVDDTRVHDFNTNLEPVVPSLPSPAATTAHEAVMDLSSPQPNGDARPGTGATAQSPTDNRCNVYVASMPKHYDDKKLAELFSHFGTIVSAKVMCDHNSRTKESKGYGFVLFKNADSAAEAISKMAGQLVEGLKIQVRLANAEAVPTARSTSFAAAAVKGQILVNVPETAPDRAPAVVHPDAVTATSGEHPSGPHSNSANAKRSEKRKGAAPPYCSANTRNGTGDASLHSGEQRVGALLPPPPVPTAPLTTTAAYYPMMMHPQAPAAYYTYQSQPYGVPQMVPMGHAHMPMAMPMGHAPMPMAMPMAMASPAGPYYQYIPSGPPPQMHAFPSGH